MSETENGAAFKPYCILQKEKLEQKYSLGIADISPFDVGIPLVDISDKTIEEIYYYRWQTFCRHIKPTPEGYVITEFLPDVYWAGKYNAISCPAGHHLREGRWLYDEKYIDSYIRYWFTPGAEPRSYSFWVADAVLSVAKISGNFKTAKELYENLKENYALWEKEKLTESGLFYQIDDRDGMEFSAGGSGLRPTINSYMCGDAAALKTFANLFGYHTDAEYFGAKAEALKEKINTVLWDENDGFYKTYNTENDALASVKELIGYIPWYFGIPDSGKSQAWKYLNDSNYFYAPYGPTTAEQNHPDFMKKFDHHCLWNGPSWPFATSQTLTALGVFLTDYTQNIMNKSDYYNLLHLYANCHYLTENGVTIPFIDENLDPFTGEWLARKIIRSRVPCGEQRDRGKYYNHSTFCDLVLSGISGINGGIGNKVTVNPLFSANDLEYFCADGIKYHGAFITVLWDKTGNRYNMGKGFRIFLCGKEVCHTNTPEKVAFDLE